MQIKLIVFKDGTYVIADVEERETNPDCVLINPKRIVDGKLFNWPEYTNQKQIYLRSEDILTLVEPKEEYVKIYRETIG
jgi:hypothetical protein